MNTLEEALRPHARKCYPKIRHATEQGATTHLRVLIARGVGRDVTRLVVYPCVHCGAWHVGHPPSEETIR